MDLKQWLAIVKAVTPVAIAATGNEKATKISSLVIAGIERAETIPGASGEQKLGAAIGILDLGLAGYNIAKPEEPIDIPSVQNAVVTGINTAIQVANLFKPKPTGAPEVPDSMKVQ